MSIHWSNKYMETKIQVPWKEQIPKHCSFDTGAYIWLTLLNSGLECVSFPLITGFSLESKLCLCSRLLNWYCFIISLCTLWPVVYGWRNLVWREGIHLIQLIAISALETLCAKGSPR